MQCKDCNRPTTDTNRDGSAVMCDECAHRENLANAVDRFCDLWMGNHTREFAMNRASLEFDVTLADLAGALDSLLVSVS